MLNARGIEGDTEVGVVSVGDNGERGERGEFGIAYGIVIVPF